MLSLSEYLLLSVKYLRAASQRGSAHTHTLLANGVCVFTVDFLWISQPFFINQSIFDHSGSPNLMYRPGVV